MAFRSFAIIPAAGACVRMGAPKLLLPLGRGTVIDRVLSAWTASGVTRVVVVVQPQDHHLAACVKRHLVDVVVARAATKDMKSTVQMGIDHVGASYSPAATDVWLVAPADLPRFEAGVIDAVLSAYVPGEGLGVAPVAHGRRIHPLLLPWSRAAEVRRLADDEGVNVLGRGRRIREIHLPVSPHAAADLDTPEQYDQLMKEELCRAASN